MIVGELFHDKIPSGLGAWLEENLDGEAVWGALKTGTSVEEGTIWLIASKSRNALAAVRGDARYWTDLSVTAVTNVETKLTKLEYSVDDRVRFTAARLGNEDLEQLFEFAFQPRPNGLLGAALAHIKAKKWAGADQLLQLAEDTLTDADREPNVAYLNVWQKLLLARAGCAMRLDDEAGALAALATISAERPGDDLLSATAEFHKFDGWLLTLALAHEEAGQPGSAARVYAALHEREPDADILLVSKARALRRAGDKDAAVEAYLAYIDHHASEAVVLHESSESLADFGAACLEAARLFEELDRPAEAAVQYLNVIRAAPFEKEAYARLFALRADADTGDVATAGQVLWMLDPATAAELDAPAHSPWELPRDFAAIDDMTHDEQVVHPGERASATLAQKWIGALTRDERDTRDIERHAQRVEAPTHADVVVLLKCVAKLAGVEVPRMYLSHGSAGIEVLGASEPFILLGACHLAEGDGRALPHRELAFALASQVEHIRAEHVLLTSSEFWRTFGTKSATALLAFVPLGDLVSKFTDGSLVKWVNKLGSASSGTIRTALEAAEKRIAAGATGETVQSAYSAALAKVRSTALETEPDETSLVKERLADFARAAQYTADRVGLLAADDLVASVSAMVRLSPSLCTHIETFAMAGFVGLRDTAAEDPALEELTLRVSALLRFALSDTYDSLRHVVLEV